MNNHSWDSLEGLACNMMKFVLVIFSLADRLAAPNNRNIVKHRIRGLLLTSRLAVPGGRDLLNQGKLQRVIYLSPSDTGWKGNSLADGTRLFQMYQRQSLHSSGNRGLMRGDRNKDKFHQTSSEGWTSFTYWEKGYCRERCPVKAFGGVFGEGEEWILSRKGVSYL